MKVNLKNASLTINDIEMNRIYVGSSGKLFYFTIVNQDNRIADNTIRYLCISIGEEYGNYMFNNKEALWKHISMFGLRKAEFELNEI